MGCDCGKQKETPAEKNECQKSAQLEAPDQVYSFKDEEQRQLINIARGTTDPGYWLYNMSYLSS